MPLTNKLTFATRVSLNSYDFVGVMRSTKDQSYGRSRDWSPRFIDDQSGDLHFRKFTHFPSRINSGKAEQSAHGD